MSDPETPAWLPAPDDRTAPFFDGAKAGKLVLQRCGACREWSYPFVTLCPMCGHRELPWEEASGDATLYSHARLHRVYHPRHTERLPLTLASVDLPEGLRINTNVVHDAPLRVGMKLRVDFETSPDGICFPIFRPAE